MKYITGIDHDRSWIFMLFGWASCLSSSFQNSNIINDHTHQSTFMLVYMENNSAKSSVVGFT